MAVAQSLGTSIKSGLVSILPKKKPNPVGITAPNDYNPNATTSDLALPGYRDHLTDIFQSRASQDSRALLQSLFQQDPDVSAAVNAYLTTANTPMWYLVKDSQGVISRPGHVALEQLLLSLSVRFDYTKPANFYFQKSLQTICENFRYMLLLRGGIGGELILNKLGWPTEIRNVDLSTIHWQETGPGVYLPIQLPTHPASGAARVPIDTPTFFVTMFHQDPTSMYTYSPFVSAINTIASRQQIINDLYRIMQLTGYPRIDVTIMEEVLRKNAPADAQNDPVKMNTWMGQRKSEIQTVIGNLRPDQALVHMDSVTVGIVNDKAAAMTLDVSAIIDVLNAQNQAALKVMSTIIGRGESGVNTASVEARIFSLNAQELNVPLASLLSQALTMALRLQGIDAIVQIGFEEIELRPTTELEAMTTMKQNRFLQLLSYGLIDDDTFHLEMFNKIRPDDVPIMQGTNFFLPPKVTDPALGAAGGAGGNTPQAPQPNSTTKAATPKDSKPGNKQLATKKP